MSLYKKNGLTFFTDKDVNRIENILLCNVGASVGMNIPISQGFLNKPIFELHFYYNMKQKNGFREDYKCSGGLSASIEDLEKRDGKIDE